MLGEVPNERVARTSMTRHLTQDFTHESSGAISWDVNDNINAE
jgi:hypothetical protein